MDPSAALGAAAAVLQFASFSAKAIASIREVAKAGSTASNAQTLLLTKDLNDVAGQLNTACDLGSSDHAHALKAILADCEQSCAKLTDLLASLSLETTTLHRARSKEPAARPRWSWRERLGLRKIEIGIKSVWKKEEIEELEMRIGKSRDQVMLRLQTLLVERQSTIQLELSGFRSKSESDNVVLKDRLELLCKSVSDLEAQLSSNTIGTQAAAQSNDFRLLQAILNTLIQNTPSPEIRILRQLFYPSMNSRKQQIKPSHENTHSWIISEDSDSVEPKALRKYKDYLDDPARKHVLGLLRDREAKCRESRARLITWLRSGDGVFHISGKAGSGKSTLMKMLLHHPRTRRELEHWAGDNALIISPFFFWRSGDEMQNSLTGLYRSILFEVLKECPELIPMVFPAAHRVFGSQNRDNCIEESFFEPEDIQRAFGRLVSGSLPPGYRFCLFIDGLDEYGEDGRDRLEHDKLARSLSAWSQQNSIKIVATSRPYVEFEATFSTTRRIHLHDLVWFDIFSFAHDTFEKHRDFHRIKEYCDRLSARVAGDSEGVFLWAAVTVRSLHSAITNHLDITELNQQLDDTPKELGALYHSLLELLSPRDRLRASKMLLMMHAFSTYYKVLDPCVLSWAEKWDDPTFPLSLPAGPYSSEEYSQRVEKVVAQIDGVTNGLLEISKAEKNTQYIGSRLPLRYEAGVPVAQFYHRTVRDFVVTHPEMRTTLAAHPEFAAKRTRARVFLSSVWFSHHPVDFQMPLYSLRSAVEELPADMFSSFKRAWQLASRDHYYAGISRTWNHHVWWKVTGPPSFNHWAVSAWADLPDSELDQMIQEQRSDPSQRKRSLLLAAARGEKVKMVERLLLRGYSPNDEVAINFSGKAQRKLYAQLESRLSTTVWMAFCIHLFSSLEHRWIRSLADGIRWNYAGIFKADFQTLELLLEAGANPEVHFKCTVGLQDDLSTWKRGADVSLRQFVLWAGPLNRDGLMELLERNLKPASPSFGEPAVSGVSEQEYLDGFQVIKQSATCGDQTIEYGGLSSGEQFTLELPLW